MHLSKTLSLPLDALKKHFLVLGGSGSGKTVFSKVLIEEAAKKKVKSIIIDTQGDLASLALGAKKLGASVLIYTPGSSKGIPLSLNPFRHIDASLSEEERSALTITIARSIAALAGYKLARDDGKQVCAFLYQLLTAHKIEDISELITLSGESDLLTPSELTRLHRRLKLLTLGDKSMLLSNGVVLDIAALLKQADITVIYLNALDRFEDKDFFLSLITKELYSWMLKHPSPDLQLVFYIDEIAGFLPAGTKLTASKELLVRLYKQARKFGIGCIVSTQNPGDIDYRAFAQFGTWALGRMTVKQDREKVKTSMQALGGAVEQLATLKTGEFLLFAPDHFEKMPKVTVRWLVTDHKTLTLEDIGKLMKGHVSPQKTKRSASALHLGIPLVLDEAAMHKIALRSAKKLFHFFGPGEKLQDMQLQWLPLYRLQVRQSGSRLLGLKKTINDYVLFVDALDGSLLRLSASSAKRYAVFKGLLGLSEKEVLVVSELLKKDGDVMDIAYTLGIAPALAAKVLRSLLAKKLVTARKKEGKDQWTLLVEGTLPSLSSLQSSAHVTASAAKGLAPKIDAELVKLAVRHFFDAAEVVSLDLVQYPAYLVTFLSKKGQRRIYLSGVDGSAY